MNPPMELGTGPVPSRTTGSRRFRNQWSRRIRFFCTPLDIIDMVDMVDMVMPTFVTNTGD